MRGVARKRAINTMITIDGAAGEGGGQVLRSALALAMTSGQPFRIHGIRAKRRKPGLMRQHLTAVLAAQQICGGKASGAEAGSTELDFTPGDVRGGEYRFAIGTAGSTSLVLQTVLPALILAPQPSRVTLEGGTHNPLSPSFEFIAHSFLPLLARMGARVTMRLIRAGFAPAGGGRVEIEIEPAQRLSPLRLDERGALLRGRAEAVVVHLPYSIAERELAVIGARLGWQPDQLRAIVNKDAPGVGNVVTVALEFAETTQMFVGFGEQGVSAESIGERLAKRAGRMLQSSAAVEPHLADQLLLPIALAGEGSFTTIALTPHATTNLDVIRQFLPISAGVEHLDGDLKRVTMRPG